MHEHNWQPDVAPEYKCTECGAIGIRHKGIIKTTQHGVNIQDLQAMERLHNEGFPASNRHVSKQPTPEDE